jgi:hypothetical protein
MQMLTVFIGAQANVGPFGLRRRIKGSAFHRISSSTS